MKPSSFCSLATFGCHDELFGLLLSLSIHHENSKVYCIVDTKTREAVEAYTPKLKLDICWMVLLDEYTGLDRLAMEAKGIWSDFQMQKAIVIDEVLKHEKDTLFLDADILILDTIDDIDESKQLGVSPHYIRKINTDLFGYYNGGTVWTNQKSLKDDWIEFTKTSRYFDQASIEDLAKKYDTFEFGENYNLSWWRFTQSDTSFEDIVLNLSIVDNKIFYKDKPLKFIHTHFYEQRSDIKSFNDLIIQALNHIKDYKTLLIINKMITGKWTIQFPEQPMRNPWNHSNDSFRELLFLLRSKNTDLEVKVNLKSGHLWLNDNILLYDRPTSAWFNDEVLRSYKVLLGNGDIKQEGLELEKDKINISPWIFWPRKPIVLEKMLQEYDILEYNNRETESIFIGNYENHIQENFRNSGADWQNVVTQFHCTAGNKYKFTQEEYLQKIRNAKYGLCLRGFGSKCHREVELMAFGTVPLVTPEVSIDSYMEKPLENIHYVRVSNPSELKEKIANINENKWREMSNACYQWYQRNVHSDNCWNNMLSYLLYN